MISSITVKILLKISVFLFFFFIAIFFYFCEFSPYLFFLNHLYSDIALYFYFCVYFLFRYYSSRLYKFFFYFIIKDNLEFLKFHSRALKYKAQAKRWASCHFHGEVILSYNGLILIIRWCCTTLRTLRIYFLRYWIGVIWQRYFQKIGTRTIELKKKLVYKIKRK